MNISHDRGRFRGWLAAVALACVLAACGGGGGGGSGDGGRGAVDALPSSGVATAWGGPYVSVDLAYVAAAIERGSRLDFYAIKYANASSVRIYSGPLTLGFNGSASVSPLNAMLENGSLRSGLGDLSGVSASSQTGVFSLTDGSAPPDVYRDILGSARSGLNEIGHPWTGTWIDGLDGIGTLSLPALAEGGQVTFTALGCSGIVLSVGSYVATRGAYPVAVTYPDTTACVPRQDASLQGLAFVHSVSGRKRLEIVVVDSQGSGIAFRADR